MTDLPRFAQSEENAVFARGIHRTACLHRSNQLALLGAGLGLAIAQPTLANVGDSFISIPGKTGEYRGDDHKGWIRVEANEWSSDAPRPQGSGAAAASANAVPNNDVTRALLQGNFGFRRSGPAGARPGSSGTLTVMVELGSKSRRTLNAMCASRTVLPEMSYSEPSGPPGAVGSPPFWEYKLKTVQVKSCPTAAGAIAQAFVLSFGDVEWLNFDPSAPPPPATAPDVPDVRPVMPGNGTTVKSYLISWLAIATDAAENQCPVMNAKPSEGDVLRFRSPAEAAAMKVRAGEKGFTAGRETETRGPEGLNVIRLPGIVPDPGLLPPQSPVAPGINLDGANGREDYKSPDGRSGIDNQLYRVVGCIPGFRGKKGYRNQTDNARRADGNIVTLVQVSGIDNQQNDDDVEVALIHSIDKPMRDNAGQKFIPNYTFRPTADPAFAAHNIRVKGRIVNGVVLTDVIPVYSVASGQGPAYALHNAQMRFEPQDDGSMKGYLGGYQDWRFYASTRASGYSESLFGYQFPALWYALKRHADGLKDPATGEYTGISTVYEIDTVPAFLVPSEAQVAEAAGKPGGAR